MLVRLPAATLLAALKVVKHGTAQGKTQLPILKGVRIRADYTSCWLETYDIDFGVTLRVSPADISAPGEIVIHHGALLGVVKQLDPSDTVTLRATNNIGGTSVLQLTASAFTTSLNELVPAEDWLKQKAMPAEVATTLRPAMITALSDVAKAASQSEDRPILNGVYVELAPTVMRATATNGHIMVTREDWSPGDASAADLIIPPRLFKVAKAVFAKLSGSELFILSEMHERPVAKDPEPLATDQLPPPATETPAEKPEPEMEKVHSPTFAWLRQGDVTLHTRLIEGPFPNYAAVIPSEMDRKAAVLVDRRSLLAAVNRVGAVASDQTHRLVLTFNGNIAVSAETPDFGNAVERVQHAGIDGDPMRIGVSAAYADNLLRIARTDRVTLELWGEDRAILIRPEHDPSTTMLLMPLRILD